jgi:restriction system protein
VARRFPAGQWSTDFLCVDENTGDFVVVELKRGKNSDTVVGQLARYMMWVTENLAKPGQKVRGIISAKEADEGLRLAVRIDAAISIKTYRVSFMLTDLGKR